jgi:hypothetical protein
LRPNEVPLLFFPLSVNVPVLFDPSTIVTASYLLSGIRSVGFLSVTVICGSRQLFFSVSPDEVKSTALNEVVDVPATEDSILGSGTQGESLYFTKLLKHIMD